MPWFNVDFCCNECAWAFLAETHRLMGVSGNDLRTHLIEAHGFGYPPGKPEGGMRHDCRIVSMDNNLASLF